MTNIQVMDEQLQRIAIAEFCGWVIKFSSDRQRCWCKKPEWVNTKHKWSKGIDLLPDYLSDLNVMREVEKLLFSLKTENGAEAANVYFGFYLPQVCKCVEDEDNPCSEYYEYAHIHASTAQRAEAFLRTIGKWITK